MLVVRASQWRALGKGSGKSRNKPPGVETPKRKKETQKKTKKKKKKKKRKKRE